MIDRLKEEYNRRVGRREVILEKVESLNESLGECKRMGKTLDHAQTVVREVARKTQNELEYYLSSLVTECLKSVFSEDIEMVVKFVSRRNSTEVDILLKTETGVELKPRDSDGAGVVDIMAFALRMVMYSLQKKELDSSISPLFILDEPFKKLNDPSRGMHEKASAMIRNLCEEFGVQIILVTLLPEMEEQAHCVYRVQKEQGLSHVRQLG